MQSYPVLCAKFDTIFARKSLLLIVVLKWICYSIIEYFPQNHMLTKRLRHEIIELFLGSCQKAFAGPWSSYCGFEVIYFRYSELFANPFHHQHLGKVSCAINCIFKCKLH